ncbi:MAG: hypothetical protein MUC81_04760 [Bacteroidia bacterium]|jgi:hypothetical protein|nr:hypothetical protein [Bacteroidia bacterium]
MLNNLKIFLLFIVLLGLTKIGVAQDTLLIKYSIDVRVTNKAGEKLSMGYLIRSCKEEGIDDAKKYFRRARAIRWFTTPFAYVGAGVFFYQVHLAFSGKTTLMNDEAYLGLGLMSVQWIAVLGFKDGAIRRGVSIYNEAMYQKRIQASLN